MQPEEGQVMTMNQQTTDRGRQELRAIIGGIFDHVIRKEKENATLGASRMDAKMNEIDITSKYDAFGPWLRTPDKLLPRL
jgi:hypothetical protein